MCMRLTPAYALTALTLLCVAPSCSGTVDLDEEAGDESPAIQEALQATGVNSDGATVEHMIWSACSTTSVKGLARQLVEEVNCLRPETMARMPDRPNLDLGEAVFPYMQSGAAAALDRALVSAPSRTMYMNSALRTLPQQLLLHRWYLHGRCGIGLAARPGTSNHEDGLAIDISYYGSWRSTLAGRGFRWLGGSDPVHFDYVGPSQNLGSLSVLAFQRLWNRNHPSNRLAEDGVWGGSTQARLLGSPAVGFRKGATCSTGLDEGPALAGIEVYWHRNPDSSYKLRALAPSSVQRVEYVVDGHVIGRSTRAQGANFPAHYVFSQGGVERTFEARGYDASGNHVALGVGSIDVTPLTAVYVRQMGERVYGIGLERAPSGVAFVEVEVDGLPLGSSHGGDRLHVQAKIFEGGARTFSVTTYGADGRARGTIRRRLVLP